MFRSFGIKTLLFTSCFSFFAQGDSLQPALEPSYSTLISKTEPRKSKYQIMEEKLHPFSFDANIGAGFLYFHKVRGNLAEKPHVVSALVPRFLNAPIKKPIGYNRTPSFEYNLGVQWTSFLKAGLAYQHQGNVVVQSQKINATPASFTSEESYLQLTTNLNLNGFFFKLQLFTPGSLSLKYFAFRPSLAVGGGPAWLSWTQVNQFGGVSRSSNTVSNGGLPNPVRQKINANAAWTANAALNFTDRSLNPLYYLSLGCRYTWWGQARNIGLLSNQGTYKLGMKDPFKVKIIYQFAPFIGFEWRFPASDAFAKRSIKRLEKSSLYWMRESSHLMNHFLWTQANVGLGLLYFDKVQGNLEGSPSSNFAQQLDVPIQKRMTYNRTPLFEYLVGYNLLDWLNLAISYQYQSEVIFQTQPLAPKINNISVFPLLYKTQFTSYVSLNALLLKSYLRFPHALICKRAKLSPYLALGIGPSWQSWSQITVNYIRATTASLLPFKQKFSANAMWMAELGLNLQSIDPFNSFSLRLGCKYNQWGQARNMGKLGQQDGSPYTLSEPFRIKMIYQFAPFLGFQWNFGLSDQYYLNLKKDKKFKRLESNTLPKGIHVQFNTALGFLFFNRVRADLNPTPPNNFINMSKTAPFKGRLSSTPAVLFEYVLSYQLKKWINLGLSYQYQPYTSIQTPILHGLSPFPIVSSSQAYFSTNLNMNAIALKVYFNAPLSVRVGLFKISPYLGTAVGASWLTFNRPQIIYSSTLNALPLYLAQTMNLKRKVCANAFFMVDVGLKALPLTKSQAFSLNLGCKYNQWGQARNIGKQSQQGLFKLTTSRPVSIKMIYQFAPYFGFQWNF